MKKLRRDILLLITASCVMTALPANAERIGDVMQIEITAYGTPPDATLRELAIGNPVERNELLQTVINGGISVKFDDGTTFHLGGDSEAVLDEFVYDPNANGGTLQLMEGVFRIIGPEGTDHPEFTVSTATTTIGIRGTDVVIVNRGKHGTIVGLASGSVSVQPINSDQKIVAEPGQLAYVDQAGEVVVVREAPVKKEDLICWISMDEYLCSIGTESTGVQAIEASIDSNIQEQASPTATSAASDPAPTDDGPNPNNNGHGTQTDGVNEGNPGSPDGPKGQL